MKSTQAAIARAITMGGIKAPQGWQGFRSVGLVSCSRLKRTNGTRSSPRGRRGRPARARSSTRGRPLGGARARMVRHKSQTRARGRMVRRKSASRRTVRRGPGRPRTTGRGAVRRGPGRPRLASGRRLLARGRSARPGRRALSRGRSRGRARQVGWRGRALFRVRGRRSNLRRKRRRPKASNTSNNSPSDNTYDNYNMGESLAGEKINMWQAYACVIS